MILVCPEKIKMKYAVQCTSACYTVLYSIYFIEVGVNDKCIERLTELVYISGWVYKNQKNI